MPIDVKNVRMGETGMDQLLDWLRRTGQPQPIEALTAQYLAILQGLVVEEEDGER
jgi:hypothetical protein